MPVPEPVTAQTDRPIRIKAVVRVATGNFLEMYDFIVFAYYAAAIGRTFFPKNSEFASLMLSFATFGVGFLIRPLGAVILGSYMDRTRPAGRSDSYIRADVHRDAFDRLRSRLRDHRNGRAAAGRSGRLLQGFSAGVELGSVSVYLAEIATPGHKGFYVSWQNASQQVRGGVRRTAGRRIEFARSHPRKWTPGDGGFRCWWAARSFRSCF